MRRRPAPAGALGSLVFATLTVSIVSTLGAPLVPTIAADHGVGLGAGQWTLTITMLVGAVATPVIGRFGDGARRRTVLVATLATVTAGSLLAALSQDFATLLAGRALQGAGYGIVPLTIALARELVPPAQVGRAVGLLSVSVAVGVGAGYPVTGLLAELADYRAAFWFAAAFSAIALVGILVAIPPARASARAVVVDVPGAVLFGAGLGTLLLAISQAADWGWGAARTLTLVAAAGLALAAWAWTALRSAQPLLDLRLAARRPVLGANLAGLLLVMGLFAGIALITLVAQAPRATGYGLGASVVGAGLLLLPVSLGALVAQPLAPSLEERHGTRAVLIAGELVVVAALVLLAAGHDRVWTLALASAAIGLGLGVALSLVSALIVRHAPADRTGSAMSLNQVLRTAGGAMGAAVAITILDASASADRVPVDAGYTRAFLAASLAVAVAMLVTLLLVPRTG